jgi:DNA mismatch repair protein MSH3
MQVCATKKVCRYHPTEVKQGMAALARAQEQLQAACAAAWSQLLRGFTAAHYPAFRAAVAAVAQLDALYALARVASSPGYCRPQVGQYQDQGVMVLTTSFIQLA